MPVTPSTGGTRRRRCSISSHSFIAAPQTVMKHGDTETRRDSGHETVKRLALKHIGPVSVPPCLRVYSWDNRSQYTAMRGTRSVICVVTS